MFKGKKVIIFDMDGTLIDSVGIWNQVDMQLINELGNTKELDEIEIQKQRDAKLIEYCENSNPYISYCEFLSSKYSSALTGEEAFNRRYEIAQQYLRNVVDYKQDVPQLLEKLKEKGYILIIASTTRKKNMEIYCNYNENIKSKANPKDCFTKIYTREDATKIKPDPEIYLTVIKDLNVKKEECLIFEDSLIGIDAANNAGIEVVAMYDKYSDGERDEINQKSQYQFNNYAEVIKYLENEI